uniref:Transmembrane protein 87A n=1 Tax=Globodera rostochiensis TaxID=31243 RepID=A0A914HNY0_GLORO
MKCFPLTTGKYAPVVLLHSNIIPCRYLFGMLKLILKHFLLWLSLARVVHANLLIPGIMTERVQLTPKSQEYIGFLQSALNGTEVEIRVKCAEDVDIEFDVEFVIRNSPCAKEFIVDKLRFSQVSNLLQFYFDNDDKIPPGYNYGQILFYRSLPQRFSCSKSVGDQFLEQKPKGQMALRNVSEFPREKRERFLRETFPGRNGPTIDGGAKLSLTSWHPVQTLPSDAIYLLILKVSIAKYPADSATARSIQTEVQWRGPFGYLSAIDYPLLHFYGFMCFVYSILALFWLIVCLRRWKDLLRIQFWIGAVILVGMVEKAVFYAEYSNMNETGKSIEGLIEVAEIASCLKRTMAHVLVIIVSVGFGVVKPRLGSTLNQVIAVGVLYFIFCTVEGLTRVSKQSTEAIKEKQIAKMPLALLEICIAWWIFSSLVSTMRALRLRRNEVKLNLYRHFTNVLGIALFVAVLYMLWSLYVHLLQNCMKDWKEIWVDTAFWHLFFCSILIFIMFLWRPSQNNQRYAFTPLLDNSEDENEDEVEEDELFTKSGGQRPAIFESVQKRAPGDTKNDAERAGGGNGAVGSDDKLAEDLKWIETNIPSSLAEALIDDEEEREQRDLEMSKICNFYFSLDICPVRYTQ